MRIISIYFCFSLLICSNVTVASAMDMVDDFLGRLKAAPPWGRIDSSQESRKKAQSLMDVLTDIAHVLTITQCRDLMERDTAWIEQERTNDATIFRNELSKLFILNRVYFKIPEWDTVEAMKYRGGWLPAAPSKDGKYAILYPVEESPNGILKLSHGGYSYYGGDYPPLLEFELFRDRYGARWSSK